MKINNLTKKFGNKTIFESFSCEFVDGKITYLLGPSGIGKTTLLRIISGLDKDYTGEITPKNLKFSYVFREPRLFEALSVEKNLKIVNPSSPYLVENILKIVELEEEKNSLPSTLSGGMKMRISLARALYNNADVYLFDEPFSSLDEETRERIIPRVFDLLKGKTVIVISHNLEEADKYADFKINL